INDSLGHLVGDRLLISMAQRISQSVRAQDKVARLGGDEFVVHLEDIRQISEVTEIAQRIISQLQQPFYLNGHEVVVTTSIGIATSETIYYQADEILRDADNALYRAKLLGKNRYELFDRQMQLEALSRLQIENQLRVAISQSKLDVFYQPIIDLKLRQIKGFEALARWQDPQRGFICPSRFIPIAEETGSIVSLNNLILEKACFQLRQWQQQYRQNLTLNVNISAIQFMQPNFISTIEQILQQTGFPAEDLVLEITETTIIRDLKRARLIIEELLTKNIKIAMDDFGTGYSSLSYLYQLPVNNIKIDRSFVRDLEVDLDKFQVLKAIANLANDLQINLVAEGIETIQQLQIIEELKCNYGQGYLFSKPVHPERVESLLFLEQEFLSQIFYENYKD
ncbi:MAG: putative bifunctional diguanylate cyclase/phosphodiesterase, partial [Prochloraceae cyanobacterium]